MHYTGAEKALRRWKSVDSLCEETREQHWHHSTLGQVSWDGDAVAVTDGDAVAVFLEVMLTALLAAHETLDSSSVALGAFVLCNQLSSTVPSPSSWFHWNHSTWLYSTPSSCFPWLLEPLLKPARVDARRCWTDKGESG